MKRDSARYGRVHNLDAVLVLEDGSHFSGEPFGAIRDAEAEVVFNTCMTGYQEITTDPSYRGQMVCMTYPLIGNYGVNEDDSESRRPWVSGLIVREMVSAYSNWRAVQDLSSWLERNNIPAIGGVDTRALTRRLRSTGTMRGILTINTGALDIDALTNRARDIKSLGEQDLVTDASIEKSYIYPVGDHPSAGRPRIVVLDCGIKNNILRSLGRRGVDMHVVPHIATAGEIMALGPEGIVVSNGPGDPSSLGPIVQTVRALMDSGTPMLGICLGHQLIGLAAGGTTSRLRFGHHGGNHPIKDLRDGLVHITSQNHEFQVDRASLQADAGVVVSQVNLNDQSVEGLRHLTRPVFSVQYHPEGAPGPQDNQYVFDRFLDLVGVRA